MTDIALAGVPLAAARPRKVRSFGRDSGLRLAGVASASLAVTLGLFVATPLDTTLGFLVVGYLVFLVAYSIIERFVAGGLTARDRVATVMIWSVASVALVPLLFIVVYVIGKGREAFSANLFTENMAIVGPKDPATTGGAKHAIIGTLEQVGLATLIAVPVGVLTAISLHEHKGRLARPTRFLVEAMSGIPSIVAGLFIFTFWVGPRGLGQGFSGLAAALALAVLMLPIVARTAEEVLKLVPASLREASYALGAPEWRTTMRVVLPAARTGLVTAVILGIARVAGETAPLVLTAFGTAAENVNPFTGNQSALPLFVYQQVFTPNPTQIARAWAGALLLLGVVLVLFVAARLVASRSRSTK